MQTTATPPHDLTDKRISDDYPRGPGSDLMHELMSLSAEVFQDHPVNRQAARPASCRPRTSGCGASARAPRLEPFQVRFGIQGAMITAVDLLRGLARLVGWKNIRSPARPATSIPITPPKERMRSWRLPTTDLICVHVEAHR